MNKEEKKDFYKKQFYEKWKTYENYLKNKPIKKKKKKQKGFIRFLKVVSPSELLVCFRNNPECKIIKGKTNLKKLRALRNLSLISLPLDKV